MCVNILLVIFLSINIHKIKSSHATYYCFRSEKPVKYILSEGYSYCYFLNHGNTTGNNQIYRLTFGPVIISFFSVNYLRQSNTWKTRNPQLQSRIKQPPDSFFNCVNLFYSREKYLISGVLIQNKERIRTIVSFV